MAKNQVVSEMAEEFFLMEVGMQIDTFDEMSKRYKVSRGTLQNAFKYLVEKEAVDYKNNGKLGRELTYLNHSNLLKIIDLNEVVGSMPLPYSKRFEGLATAVLEILNETIQSHLVFLPGSLNRVNLLLKGSTDFSIMSYEAAKTICSQNNDLEIYCVMDDYSYISNHVLLTSQLKKDFNYHNIRMGIDDCSLDQIHRSEGLFKDLKSENKIKYIKIRYSNLIESLVQGEVDFVVWSKDNINIHDRRITLLEDLPVSDSKDETKAAIVGMKNNKLVKKIICQTVCKRGDDVLSIQKNVIDGLKSPVY